MPPGILRLRMLQAVTSRHITQEDPAKGIRTVQVCHAATG